MWGTEACKPGPSPCNKVFIAIIRLLSAQATTRQAPLCFGPRYSASRNSNWHLSRLSRYCTLSGRRDLFCYSVRAISVSCRLGLRFFQANVSGARCMISNCCFWPLGRESTQPWVSSAWRKSGNTAGLRDRYWLCLPSPAILHPGNVGWLRASCAACRLGSIFLPPSFVAPGHPRHKGSLGPVLLQIYATWTTGFRQPGGNGTYG